jgi:hypothetical protein
VSIYYIVSIYSIDIYDILCTPPLYTTIYDTYSGGIYLLYYYFTSTLLLLYYYVYRHYILRYAILYMLLYVILYIGAADGDLAEREHCAATGMLVFVGLF